MFEEYCIKSTGDKTDRTAEVLEKLQKYGVCNFGAGDFYVKNLVMPDYSTVSGVGNATRLILDENEESGYVLSMKSYCTIKNMMLVGSEENIELCENLGERHGIVWYGNYAATRTEFPERATIHGVYIHGFTGGGITHYNTGYPVVSGINVSDCFIWNCCAGVNINYWSEFNRYTNIGSSRNYYGLINNGGNNVFVNCNFSSNMIGVLMDNKDNQSPNNSHGDMIGCTIDHSGHNEGVGIKILNMKVGYVFSACQLMSSNLEVVDSDGIVFDGMNFSVKDLTVKGKGTVLFSNCIFKCRPDNFTIGEETNVKFIDCYTRKTAEKIEI